jgi:hypothetical protein
MRSGLVKLAAGFLMLDSGFWMLAFYKNNTDVFHF